MSKLNSIKFLRNISLYITIFLSAILFLSRIFMIELSEPFFHIFRISISFTTISHMLRAVINKRLLK